MNQTSTSGIRELFKKWPKLYYGIATIFGPLLYSGLSPIKFIKKYPTSGLKLNLGSGPRRLLSEIKNVDIFQYEGVDIVADISSLPLADNAVTQIVCDNVLEHIADPVKVISEVKRVLQTGGYVYVASPFLYPFHYSPNDYNRWTAEGLKELFKDFEIIETGVRNGPFSALAAYCCYIFATIFSFGFKKLYWILLDISIFIFFPIKLFDLIFSYWPNSINMAAVIYVVAKKK